MPIVLQIDYLEGADIFRVVIAKEGKSYTQDFTVSQYRELCRDINRGFKVGELTISFAQRFYPGIPVRVRRSLCEHFRARLKAYETLENAKRAFRRGPPRIFEDHTRIATDL